LDIITSALSPCYPNPARIGNEIKFNFRVGGLEGTTRNVELKVYNILGKLVAEIVNGERLVNDYTETWKPWRIFLMEYISINSRPITTVKLRR